MPQKKVSWYELTEGQQKYARERWKDVRIAPELYVYTIQPFSDIVLKIDAIGLDEEDDE